MLRSTNPETGLASTVRSLIGSTFFSSLYLLEYFYNAEKFHIEGKTLNTLIRIQNFSTAFKSLSEINELEEKEQKFHTRYDDQGKSRKSCILMTRNYLDLGSASDWLKFIFSTNQKYYPGLG